MTRFLVVSDLHTEFMSRERAKEFVGGLAEADVAILAGDIATRSGLSYALGLFCDKYSKVIFVCGNHEYYGSSRLEVTAVLRDIELERPNLIWLDNDATVIDGQRIVGTPLWFEEARGAPKWSLNDFHQIKDYDRWVYAENALAKEFLANNVQPGDMVVTHYLPSPRSVHPRYAGSPLNAFFVCDITSTIERTRPAIWIHGHTHSTCQYKIGPTEVLCNPYGYDGYDTNDEFRPDLVLDRGVSVVST